MRSLLLVLTLATLIASPAHAYCSYRGVLYAKTTLAQEFADARWVVRARLVSWRTHWSDDGDSWTVYHLKVVRKFKGRLPARFTLFTLRDSGGFYLEPVSGKPKSEDWLLFLQPYPIYQSTPSAARGATAVLYSCGQSKLWSELTSAEIRRLSAFSARRHLVL